MSRTSPRPPVGSDGRLDDADGNRRLSERRQTHSRLVNASSASVRTATPLGPLGM